MMTATPTIVTLTDNAVKKVKGYLAADESLKGKALRMFVHEGGCSGHEYGFGFDDAKPDAHVVNLDGLDVVVDPASAELLKGSTVDYVESVEGEGFAVTNPNAKGGCGCGHSFNA